MALVAINDCKTWIKWMKRTQWNVVNFGDLAFTNISSRERMAAEKRSFAFAQTTTESFSCGCRVRAFWAMCNWKKKNPPKRKYLPYNCNCSLCVQCCSETVYSSWSFSLNLQRFISCKRNILLHCVCVCVCVTANAEMTTASTTPKCCFKICRKMLLFFFWLVGGD